MVIQAPALSGYELLASGNGRRIERFGSVVTDRPEPQALWKFSGMHANADAIFSEGFWQAPEEVQKGWQVSFPQFGISLGLRLTPFRHVGLFPEQSENWQWLLSLIKKKPQASVLNLFGYTGGASLVAAKAGAHVTHVDASAPSIRWAKENAALSGLPTDAIRWIEDDALKFMRREIRRGKTYDIILMDPPTFGRGPKGEIFRLEERVKELCALSRQLVSPTPVGFLFNAYATTLYPETLLRVAEGELHTVFPKLEVATLCLGEKNNNSLLPTGFFLRS